MGRGASDTASKAHDARKGRANYDTSPPHWRLLADLNGIDSPVKTLGTIASLLPQKEFTAARQALSQRAKEITAACGLLEISIRDVAGQSGEVPPYFDLPEAEDWELDVIEEEDWAKLSETDRLFSAIDRISAQIEKMRASLQELARYKPNDENLQASVETAHLTMNLVRDLLERVKRSTADFADEAS